MFRYAAIGPASCEALGERNLAMHQGWYTIHQEGETIAIQACISTNKGEIKCIVSSDSRNHMWQMPKVGVVRKITRIALKRISYLITGTFSTVSCQEYFPRRGY